MFKHKMLDAAPLQRGGEAGLFLREQRHKSKGFTKPKKAAYFVESGGRPPL
jgi:hypothetical protein